jgi:hypothetical protein
MMTTTRRHEKFFMVQFQCYKQTIIFLPELSYNTATCNICPTCDKKEPIFQWNREYLEHLEKGVRQSRLPTSTPVGTSSKTPSEVILINGNYGYSKFGSQLKFVTQILKTAILQ